ncbi:MAG: hypothetical protein WC862_04220 [Patescibacteria group bacterium]
MAETGEHKIHLTRDHERPGPQVGGGELKPGEETIELDDVDLTQRALSALVDVVRRRLLGEQGPFLPEVENYAREEGGKYLLDVEGYKQYLLDLAKAKKKAEEEKVEIIVLPGIGETSGPRKGGGEGWEDRHINLHKVDLLKNALSTAGIDFSEPFMTANTQGMIRREPYAVLFLPGQRKLVLVNNFAGEQTFIIYGVKDADDAKRIAEMDKDSLCRDRRGYSVTPIRLSSGIKSATQRIANEHVKQIMEHLGREDGRLQDRGLDAFVETLSPAPGGALSAHEMYGSLRKTRVLPNWYDFIDMVRQIAEQLKEKNSQEVFEFKGNRFARQVYESLEEFYPIADRPPNGWITVRGLQRMLSAEFSREFSEYETLSYVEFTAKQKYEEIRSQSQFEFENIDAEERQHLANDRGYGFFNIASESKSLTLSPDFVVKVEDEVRKGKRELPGKMLTRYELISRFKEKYGVGYYVEVDAKIAAIKKLPAEERRFYMVDEESRYPQFTDLFVQQMMEEIERKQKEDEDFLRPDKTGAEAISLVGLAKELSIRRSWIGQIIERIINKEVEDARKSGATPRYTKDDLRQIPVRSGKRIVRAVFCRPVVAEALRRYYSEKSVSSKKE